MSHHYVTFRNVHFSYPNGQEVLKGVDFTITHGEKVALLGLNGAGKSTLLLQTNGLLLPTTGEVNIGGVPAGKKTLRLIREAVGMVFQNPDDQLFMPTVREDVAFGPINMGLPEDEVDKRVDRALRDVGAIDLIDRAPFQLSGGQKRRVALATVLSMQPNILVLDEPTSNLDWPARRQFIDIIQGFEHTCIIATHDLDMARELCRRTIVISDGRVFADGLTDRVLSDPGVISTLKL